MGAVDAHREICERGYEKNMKIFALVHDSILAEVDDDYIQEYQNILLKNVQKDRGLSIPGSPIGCDFEIGNDYSMGKFEAKYETVE
jgi:DNA polymerase I-like protein with 3'-5' exonuclease and polymerase domains